jgi:filamentous hemagglutinin
MKNNSNTTRTLIIIVAALAIYFFGDQLGLTNQNTAPATQSSPTQPSSTTPVPDTDSQDSSLIMQDVQVYDLNGDLAYEGDMDLAPVLDRIDRGESDPHDNDGSVFGNYEGLLPKKPKGYYREYVVRTPGMRSVGPQRLILGENGEVYYTADHYESFTQVR